DFLGLKTLSVLQQAIRLLAQRGIQVDLARLEWDDEKTYALLQRGDTVGVFQVESEGMRKTLAAVKPTVFEDIIALGALYRPGPMDNIPMFGRRKNGQEEIEYPHPLLEPILKETYGIFVYQEQVMQAAQILAGYSLGGADLLRRAMGKKIKAEMDAQRASFVEGCKTNNIDKKKANELFDLIDKFAGYGFNKSHAAAYALLTYQTAWLKAHYPAEFYAASMDFDIHQTDKLCVFVDDMRRMGLSCLPPDINRSAANFTVEPDPADPSRQAVRYALGGLKGVGEKAMEILVEQRDRGGAFPDLDDFAERIEPRLINRRQLESLAAGGAFDCMGIDRAVVHAAAETILSVAAKAAEQRESGQGGLFGGGEVAHANVPLPTDVSWARNERMEQEKEAFGFYFSAHPVDRYRQLCKERGVRSYAELCGAADSLGSGDRTGAAMAGLVEELRWRDTRKGGRFVSAKFSDSSGQFQASCFDEEGCKLLAEMFEAGECALLTVELDRQPGEETPRVTVRGVTPFSRVQSIAKLRLVLDIDKVEAIGPLKAMLADRRGGRSRIEIRAPLPDGDVAQLCIGEDFQLDGELSERIETIAGIKAVSMTPLGPQLRVVA
ncbi:MAG: DNA polymerase III subunit alpha, partial [Sphingomonadales bacterium]|nr:DNA polymerase III subunit alpha [Sphingomonadales bacterium]